MGGTLAYEKLKYKSNRPTSESEKLTLYSKDFLNCKGLYPDYPEISSLTESMCRTCHKTDGMKMPRVEVD